jgi:predicted ATPase
VAALANHSHGNPFAIRSLLTLLKNEGRLFFDFGTNSWTYSKSAVNEFLEERSKINPENVDGAFLLQHLRELPVGAQKVLSVAAAIGPSFQAQTISSFMEEMEPTDFSDDASDDAQVTNSTKLTKVWVSGLQIALAEGMVVNVSDRSPLAQQCVLIRTSEGSGSLRIRA